MTTRNAGAATRSSEGSGCWPAAACGRKPETLALKTTRLKEKLAKLESEMQRLAIIEKQMLTSPDQQISLTDPDSRSMATSGRSGVVGYNVQVAVDTKHHLIVTHEVTHVGTDQSQLANLAKETKTTPEATSLDGRRRSRLLQQRTNLGM